MKLKGLHFADVAEIQEAVTGELKKVQKHFQKPQDRAKAVHMEMKLILIKKGTCLRFKKENQS